MKKNGTSAPASDASATALAERPAAGGNAAMALPDWLAKGDLRGTEGIGKDDIRLPRLAIAQSMSPQMIPAKTQYIDDLKLYDLFNDLSKEIYGRAGTALRFVVCRRDVRRIEFDEDNNIVDMSVPAGDPRCDWTTENGARVPPKATKFVEFVVLLLHEDGREPEPIVISIKDTNKWNRAAATNLSSWIKLLRGPIFLGLYEIKSGSETNDEGTFGVPVVSQVGVINEHTLGDKAKAIFALAENFHEDLKGKKIEFEREPGLDDVVGDE